MRMWMVDPGLMCRQHLLGEHVELHMLCGCLSKKKSIRGYIERGQLEPQSIEERHRELVAEMERRGYNHDSPLDVPDTSYLPDTILRGRVNSSKSLKELQARCEQCRKRAENS